MSVALLRGSINGGREGPEECFRPRGDLKPGGIVFGYVTRVGGVLVRVT